MTNTISPLKIQITSLSHDGRGIGHDPHGKTVFIDGTLPGEELSYTVLQSKRRFNIGRVVEVLQPAPSRVTPRCEHFLICGGCGQQHIDHAVQLAAKQQSLIEQLTHFGNVSAGNILPPLVGPIWGYRTKARLGVRYVIKKSKVLVGFREKNSNYLADINSCEILHPTIGNLLESLKTFIGGLDSFASIAQLEVAVGDDQLAIIVRHLEPLSDSDLQAWCEFAQLHVFDLYLQPGGMETIHKVYPDDLSSRLYYSLPDFGLKMAFHPTDFTQINPAINQQMLQQALGLLEINVNDRILDLFCGLGNFTLPMAQLAQHVVGVEGAPAMVERAYENAQANLIHNVEFFAADLNVEQSDAAWATRAYDKVLLDPPRSGAAAVLPLIAKIQPKKILYVSCNPATLARDCGVLVNTYGYRLASVGIMDMFPHTMHVEAMALLERV